MTNLSKKVLSILLAIVILASMFPAMVFAANATEVIIGNSTHLGIKLNAAKPYWKNGENSATTDSVGYNAYFDSATGTLTLNNVNITDYYDEPSYNTYSGIRVESGDLKIVLNGTNLIDISTYTCSNIAAGIYIVSGDLTFESSSTGSLITKAALSPGVSRGSQGIRALNITINGGTIEAFGQAADNISAGLYANGSSGGGTIIINGGTITANGGTAVKSSQGVSGENITINGGTITAIGGGAGVGSYGVGGKITINSGTITATGETSAFGRDPTADGAERIVSVSINGTPTTSYDSQNYLKYKYYKIYFNPDIALVATVKGLVEGASYTMAQAAATDETAVKTAIETKIATLALDGVTTSVTKVLYTPAVAGVYATPNGTNGTYTFTVSLSKGTASDTTATLTMTVTATVFNVAAADTGSVATFKGLVEGATYTMAQVDATNEAAVKTAIETKISTLALDGVATTVTRVLYTPAVAGVYATPNGTNGTYTFKVALLKGTASDTTATLTMTIMATVFNVAAADTASVATVKGLVSGATYTMTQASATDEAAVKAAIETKIATLALDGVAIMVTKVLYAPAIAGVYATPNGSNGTYTFTVGLSKGAASDTTATLTMTVTATVFDRAPVDLASVATVKGLVEGATYTMAQAAATDEAAVKAVIETKIATLALDGVATTVTKVLYTPAVAGVEAMPTGTDGTYTFTVSLSKGTASDTTATLTMTVTATVFNVVAADTASVTTVKGLVSGATYTMTQASATDEATVKAAIETKIATLALDGVATTVTRVLYTPAVAGVYATPNGTNGTYTFTVSLSKGTASDTTATLTMTITATVFNVAAADTASVATVKGLVSGATYTMTQASATDEAAVKTAIETKIATLALDGVATTVTRVLYTPAVAGVYATPNGTNGTYTFKVALLKGTASDTTATLTMTIMATVFNVAAADTASVATVKGLVSGATYTMTQASATDEAAVKAAIETKIATLALDGVAIMVTKVLYAPAIAGVYATPNGTNGTYTFKVALLKGTASDTTATLTMTIMATVFNVAAADTASVATVKGLVSGATYTMTQASATDEAAVKAAIETKIATLALDGVATTVTRVLYTPAVAGVYATPNGTNGTYTFTVALLKGTASDTTATLTMTITATEYTAPDDDIEEEVTNSYADILVNGKLQSKGETTSSITDENGQTVITVVIDDTKLNDILKDLDDNSTLTIQFNVGSDAVVGVLNGQMVKSMETKESSLEIKTDLATYTLPAAEIKISEIANQLGENVQLKDIQVSIKILKPSKDTVNIVEDTANKNNYQLVVKPIEFEISCTYGDKTVNVTKFSRYVERMIAIPDGIDPSTVTTAVVMNSDGTFSHVPTYIVMIDGKYYAKISSLTNSTYTLIYNNTTLVDAHWAKDAINEMSSKLILNGAFDPNKDITRAEFAEIIVKGLGLMLTGTGNYYFSDVSKNDSYYGAVSIAYEYGIVLGYDNGKFGPMDKVTREQAVIMIARAMKIAGLKTEIKSSEINSIFGKYTDRVLISTCAKTSMAECLKTGIIIGRSTSILAPQGNMTFAEAAVIVQRLLKKADLIN